jgi:uncharacterized protein YbjT (DUF2867 family)
MARCPQNLQGKLQAETEIVEGDVLNPASLPKALEDIHTAYYLVHSMGSSGSFEEEDRLAAQYFAEAARDAGVEHIIYLGGLGRKEDGLSPHLRSRHEVGRILRSTGIKVTEFRASIVIGSGSLSFEMIRSLVDKLPVMITPKWVTAKAQPIAIHDLISYLIEALSMTSNESQTVEIGGSEIMSYGDIMKLYASCRGKKLWMVPVPVLTPWLSSLWLGLVTPLYARVGRKLIVSIVHSTVVEDPSALNLFSVRPMNMREAIELALNAPKPGERRGRWSDAQSAAGRPTDWTGKRFGKRLSDSRSKTLPISPQSAFKPIKRIGGTTGWYAYNTLWKVRGAIDLLVGGIGIRRGRPDEDTIAIGDTLDFWRVEAYEENTLLRLRAEMKVPGRAWLEFKVMPVNDGVTITQTARFDPSGLFGKLYWYALIPLHQLVFAGMLNNIAKAAMASHDQQIDSVDSDESSSAQAVTSDARA